MAGSVNKVILIGNVGADPDRAAGRSTSQANSSRSPSLSRDMDDDIPF